MDISALTDEELWEKTKALAARERGATADLVEHLAVLDDRRLWKKHEYASLYEYCVYYLRLSDGAAYKRIRAARAIALFPSILTLLREGQLSLTAIALLHPHLEAPDAAELVRRACGMRIKNLERLIAPRQKAAPRRDVVRFVPPDPPPAQLEEAGGSAKSSLPPATSAIGDFFSVMAGVFPAAAAPPDPATCASVRIAFTADADFFRMLSLARALLRHKYPDGRLEGVLRDALKALIDRRLPKVGIRRRRAAAA